MSRLLRSSHWIVFSPYIDSQLVCRDDGTSYFRIFVVTYLNSVIFCSVVNGALILGP